MRYQLDLSLEMADEHDRFLPIANVGRIMKHVLPRSAKISKEAKETMQECASEFISFVTGEASDKCHKENRKTVNGDDICWALSTLGFDDYSEALLRYLHKYRQYERERTNHSKASSTSTEDKEAASSYKNSQPDEKQADAPIPLELRVVEMGENPPANTS
ncbi:unnamed protein product [Ilex paraguariensis]|uniref:Transcription factor CBF/NF-Y/archaeal histone domain-containing protein n=1 Tax=Ilex paraguariensis TaxID=185542 RepID=A0ABC8TDN8_9AQUA